MENNTFNELYKLILDRKDNPVEGSYTSYLYSKGLDKILKKVGEESTEVVIAAKDKNKEELVNEICDLTYHLFVLMANEGIELNEVVEELEERRKKIGNTMNERKDIENL